MNHPCGAFMKIGGARSKNGIGLLRKKKID
jgi:hypothetical protein